MLLVHGGETALNATFETTLMSGAALPAPAAVTWPSRVVKAAAVLALTVGAAVLLGWAAGLAPLLTLAPRWPAMAALTALSIALLGVAMLAPRLTSSCAGAVATVALVRLAAHVMGWDLGIDTLGLADPRGADAEPPSMSPGTALALLLLSLALLNAGRPPPSRRFQLMAQAALLLAWLGISRFLFGGEPLFPIARMAFHTAVLLFVLALGVLCWRTDVGIVRLLVSGGLGGAMARRLLGAALLLPPLAGWLRLQGTQAGWFGAEAGLALLTAALAVAFGTVVWLTASLLDRLEGQRQQSAMRVLASQRELRAIVETALDAVVTINAAGIVTGWSTRAAATFGWTIEQAMGQPLDALIVPAQHREAHRHGMARYLATGESTMLNRRVEMTALHRDGHEFPVDMSIAPVGTGDALKFSAFIRDISERKRAESAQERLAAIVEHSEDAIISKSLDGLIVSWNRGAQQLLGYTADEVIGKPVLMLVPDRLADEERRALAHVRNDKQSALFESVRRRKDGSEVEVSVQLSPVLNASGEVVGGSSITRDITEQKLRAAELQRSNAELEHFASVASHDLQEPLRMVANYTELLAKRYRGQLDEKADKYIHYASDGARRMQRLVADLLSFSRVGSQGQPMVATSSQQAVQGVLDGLQQLVAETGAQVQFDSLPMVVADEGQLRQLFQNLISNAIKFRGDSPPRIAITAAQRGPFWQFSLADNGIGMDMRFAERIFQMFQRLHEVGRFEGSGIGLAITKRIVERHGGRIWVESEPGRGTTFHFTLAAAEKGAP
jgi:PAS domain S-box-containing protein